MKKISFTLMVLSVIMTSLIACTGKTAPVAAEEGCCGKGSGECCKNTAVYAKKYTNADFYTDGKFNEEVAKQAMKDMFAFYDVPFTPLMEKDMWVVDFGLGDFEHVGMGGIFWVNDAEHGYFAHAIYLLPDQMIPEHAHVKTTFPPKFESWMVTKGWAYNFSEIGDPTPDAPAIPEAHGDAKSKAFVVQHVGEVIHLKKAESFHFLMAGSEGAIVDEWASYHDGAGLRFTNPKAKL
ncbi:D-lyxose ketol-isomerase [Bacteroidales bacterium Barb6]|nr:D-lyxose ketol-isomerase [Bacteroidales bacterium Barb6]